MEMIVSLTSYPDRIKSVHKVIKTLLIQNRKPDKIILWLSQSQFAGKEKDLPNELLKLMDFGLIIRWCDDLKPHKKYYYAMQEFPDDIIITVDDDSYYSPRLTEVLYESFLKYPDAISCTRANRIVIGKDKKLLYAQWEKDYRDCCDEKCFDLLAVGVGGILYPPHCLPAEAFDKEKINTICPYQDDLWLKAMEIKSNVPTVLVSNGDMLISMMEEGLERGLYNTINKEGNDSALYKIMEELDLQTGEKDYLIKKLIHSPYSVTSLLYNRNKNIKVIEKRFMEDIKERHVVIYGAGTGAKLVMEALSAFDKSIVPYAFVVTDKKNNPEQIFDIPVLAVNELIRGKDEYYVIVSTAEVLHKEIRDTLEKLNFVYVVFVKDKVMGKMLYGKKNIFDANNEFICSLYEQKDMEL